MFRNKMRVYGKELLAPCPNLELKDHPFSTVRDYLFNIFAGTLHIEGRSSTPNLRMRHAMVTSTQLSWTNKEHIKVRECLLSFGVECFVFQFAIQKFKD